MNKTDGATAATAAANEPSEPDRGVRRANAMGLQSSAAALAADDVDVRLDRIETVGSLADLAVEQELRSTAEATGSTYTPASDTDELADKLTALTARDFRDVVRLGGEPVHGTPWQRDARGDRR